MSEESLAVQKLIVARLKASAPLLALVPASKILDQQALPDVFPCILIGEAQTVGDDVDCGPLSEVFSTIHVWSRDVGMVEAKRIAGAIRRALWDAEDTLDGFEIGGTFFEDMRFMRDPDGKSAHGVITFKSLVGGID
ncbi:MAG: DUF3168 domain-containing protein [Pseudaminobacter sp.]|nr:DUF3168 domain-containing protein [Pseudaminobacter sp.]